MTAQRWWVRMAARWLARVDGVSGQLRLAMLGLTGISTATLSLQQYGYGEFAVPLIVVIAVSGLVFTYLYTEGGVWNQMARDRQDMSANFAGPNAVIQAEANMRAWLAAEKGRELTDDERKAIRKERQQVFEDLRDGIDIEG